MTKLTPELLVSMGGEQYTNYIVLPCKIDAHRNYTFWQSINKNGDYSWNVTYPGHPPEIITTLDAFLLLVRNHGIIDERKRLQSNFQEIIGLQDILKNYAINEEEY